ncbi:MAG: hypothetical protein J0L60_03455 [Ignavibacteria bacterium]|nr:hypothetical protein [Ignavibacteria bacterium]
MRFRYLILTLVLWQQIFCQYRPVFIGVEQGLSSSAVRSIQQDSAGFLWIATWDGLYRYDGHEFRNFNHTPGDSYSLSSNNLLNVAIDGIDRPWVTAVSGEINLLDRRTNKFSLLRDSKGKLLKAVYNGFPVKFDKNHMIFLSPDGVILTRISDLTSVKLDEVKKGAVKSQKGEEVIVFYSGQDLLLVDRSKKVTRVATGFDVIMISEIKEGTVLVLSKSGELFEYNVPVGEFKRVVRVLSVATPPSFDGYKLHIDDKGVIRVATSEGFFSLDKERKVFNELIPGENEETIKIDGRIFAISEDYAGNIWTGTSSGLIKLEKRGGRFINYPEDDDSGINPQADRITSMIELPGSKILTGTTGGIYTLDLKTGKFIKNQNLPPGFDRVLVYRLFRDSKGDIWAGTKKGLLKLQFTGDRPGTTAIPFRANPSVDEWINRVTSITEDKDGHLWIGTVSGIIKYNPVTGDYKIFNYHADFGQEGDTYILSLLHDDGYLWAGTNSEGLLRINTRDMTHTRYSTQANSPLKLNNDKIMAIHKDRNGNIWLATMGGGVSRLGADLKTVRTLTTAEGLANNTLYGILEDESGNIWVSSNKGISKINSLTLKSRNYTKSDGLASGSFNQNSYLRGNDGKFYFGGTDGITVFNPGEMIPDTVKPKVALTDFRIFNKPSLNRIVNREVELNYDENFFSFEMAALNFENPAYNGYMWKLEGLTEEWVNSGNRRTVDLSNIPPGNYRLIVKVSNREGVWSDETFLAKIVVTPPFWKTVWFTALASIIALSTIVSIPIMITKRKMRKKIEALEKENLVMAERAKTRDRIARDLHDDLASTVSGAGLYIQSANSILGENEEVAKTMIGKSASLLQEAEQAMRDIVWSVSPENDSVDNLVLRIKLLAGELCEAAGIRFEFSKMGNTSMILQDEIRRNMYLSVKEAVINSVKHSGADLISISISSEATGISIVICDNGRGFRMESQAEKLGGNGIKNIRKRCEEIGAEVKISTGEGKGTIIEIHREMKK